MAEPVKWQVVRVTGEGEQIMVEAVVPGSIGGTEQIYEYLNNKVFKVCDARMRESNRRIQEAMKFEFGLPEEIRGHVALGVRRVLDLLHGRAGLAGVAPDGETIQKDKEAVEQALAAQSVPA